MSESSTTTLTPLHSYYPDGVEYGLEMEAAAALGMTKRSLVRFVTGVVLTIIVLGVLIVVAAYAHDADTATTPLKRVRDKAIIQVLQSFDSSGTWRVPEWITNDGRVLITLSGGGGGGCSGSSLHRGGGGNSGVSAIRYPGTLTRNDFCRITIGSGGASNVRGGDTSIECTAPDSKTHVYLDVQGGSSGCTPFNSTQPSQRIGYTLSYPYVAERIGGRPSSGYAPERHPYGGAPGVDAAGGAGSVFGDGGDSAPIDESITSSAPNALIDSAGQNAIGHGAGGGGGAKMGGIGGSGARGKVVIVYYSQVKS